VRKDEEATANSFSCPWNQLDNQLYNQHDLNTDFLKEPSRWCGFASVQIQQRGALLTRLNA